MALQLTKNITEAVEKAKCYNEPKGSIGKLCVIVSHRIYDLLLNEQPAFRRTQQEPYSHTVSGVPIYKATRKNFNGWLVVKQLDGEEFV